MSITDEKVLGNYLKDRRARLDPESCGFALGRRRTPGLRREEVAQRANVSLTWYTWLEQGRGGAPSAEALERISAALLLTEVERDHLFMLGLGRPCMPHRREEEGVSIRLQRILDSLVNSPAYIKNTCWDVISWNQAAAAVLTDYALRDPNERNILRMIFCDADVRSAMPDWETHARFVVAAFRNESTRAGMPQAARDLVADLSLTSTDFGRLWRTYDVGVMGEGTKLVQHVDVGAIALDYTSFRVESQPDLSMVVFNPASAADAIQVQRLLARRAASRAADKR